MPATLFWSALRGRDFTSCFGLGGGKDAARGRGRRRALLAAGLAAAACVAAPAGARANVDDARLNTATGTIYYILDDFGLNPLTWSDAETMANGLSFGGNTGHLATIDSQATQDFIWNTYNSGNPNRPYNGTWGDLWVGLQRVGGNLQWVATGNPPTYANWDPGEPAGAPHNYTYLIQSGGGTGTWATGTASDTHLAVAQVQASFTSITPYVVQGNYSTPEMYHDPSTLNTYALIGLPAGANNWQGLFWSEGDYLARQLGGQQVTIDSERTNSAVTAAFADYAAWIGVTNDPAFGGGDVQPPGPDDLGHPDSPTEGWVWVQNSTTTALNTYGYQSWAYYEPNNFFGTERYGQLRFDGHWNDLSATNTQFSVAEFTPTTPGFTITRYDWNAASDGNFGVPAFWRNGVNGPPQGPPGSTDAAYFDTGNVGPAYNVSLGGSDQSVAVLAVRNDNVIIDRGGNTLNPRELYVGFDGQTSHLTLSNSGGINNGNVNSTYTVVGMDQGSVGTLDVNDTIWINTDQMIVGNANGATGTLNLNAAVVQVNTNMSIGRFPGSTGTVTVDINSLLDVAGGTLNVGNLGNGTLTSNGGEIVAGNFIIGTTNSEDFNNGGQPLGGVGLVTLNGGTLTSYYDTQVGQSGQGTLTAAFANITTGNGAYVGYDSSLAVGIADLTDSYWSVGDVNNFNNLTDMRIGGNNGATGTVTLRGSTVDISRDLYLGSARDSDTLGGTGTLNVLLDESAQGSTVNVYGSLFVGTNVMDGSYNATGVLNVDGSGSFLDVNGDISVGVNQGADTIYNVVSGANGAMNVTNGAVVYGGLLSDENHQYTSFIDGPVLVDGSGSQWNQTGYMEIGVHGAGTMTVSNGAAVVVQREPSGQFGSSTFVGAFPGADGVLTVTDPDSSFTTEFLAVGSEAAGRVRVDHGAQFNTHNTTIGYLDRGGAGTAVLQVYGNSTFTVHNPDPDNPDLPDPNFPGVLIVGGQDVGALIVGHPDSNPDYPNPNYAPFDPSDYQPAFVQADRMIVGDSANGVGTVEVRQVSLGFPTSTPSLINVAEDLIVGRVQHTNDETDTLYMENGSQTEADSAIVGDEAEARGSITTSGWTSTSFDGGVTTTYTQGRLDVANQLTLGRLGYGTLDVMVGSQANAGSVVLAELPGSTGTLSVHDHYPPYGQDVENVTSTLNTGDLTIGRRGDGTMDILAGGLVNSGDSWIARYAGSSGVATVSGTGTVTFYPWVVPSLPSTWLVSGALTVGGGETDDPLTSEVGLPGVASATLNINDGGQVIADSLTIAALPQAQGNVTVSELDPVTSMNPSLTVNGAASVGNGSLNAASGGSISIGQTLTITSAGAVNINPGGTLNSGPVVNAGALNVGQNAVDVDFAVANTGPIDGSGITTVLNGGTLTADRIRQTALHIGSGGTAIVRASGADGATIPPQTGGTDASVSRVGSLVLGGATDAWTGKLDVNDNKLIIDNANSAVAATTYTRVNNQLKQGFDNGAWDGQGIISTKAQTNVNNGIPVTIGVINNDDGSGNPAFFHDGTDLPQFGGQTVNGTAVLTKYTYFGDADLSGNVDAVDYTFFVAGVQSGGSLTGWEWGDFDYSGAIDAVDYTFFVFGVQGQGASLASGGTGPANPGAPGAEAPGAVPEPTSLALLGVVGVVVMMGRHKRG